MKILILIAAWCLAASSAFALDDPTKSPEESARHAHDLAASDMIYVQEDTRALYFQNLRIIELLEEIREEIHLMNARAAQDQAT